MEAVPRRLNGEDERVTTLRARHRPRAGARSPARRGRPAGGARARDGAGGGVAAKDLVSATAVGLAEGFSVALVEQPYRVAGRALLRPQPTSTPRGRASSRSSAGAGSRVAARRRWTLGGRARRVQDGRGDAPHRRPLPRVPRSSLPGHAPGAKTQPARGARRGRRRGDGGPGHVGRLRDTARARPAGRCASCPETTACGRAWRRRAARREWLRAARALPIGSSG